jgi:hypothetical protein
MRCRPVLTNRRPTPSVRIFTRRDSIPGRSQVSCIRRRLRRVPPRSPPPAAPGSAVPTGRSRCRPRWRAVPERPPGTPRPMPADRRIDPASTSSQRDRLESTLPRSTARARQRGSSPRWARRPHGRTARPTTDEERGVWAAAAGPGRDRPRTLPLPTQRPRRLPRPTPTGDVATSAPESMYATLSAVTQLTGFWECCRH